MRGMGKGGDVFPVHVRGISLCVPNAMAAGHDGDGGHQSPSDVDHGVYAAVYQEIAGGRGIDGSKKEEW